MQSAGAWRAVIMRTSRLLRTLFHAKSVMRSQPSMLSPGTLTILPMSLELRAGSKNSRNGMRCSVNATPAESTIRFSWPFTTPCGDSSFPRRILSDLLRAFESDVSVNRHPDFPSLLAYCACSANPVGRLVLELFGHRDPELLALSDCICTALQLTNFWQDVARDLERDRIYLPLEDLRRFNYTLDDLRAGHMDDRWRELLKFEIARTRQLFDQGKALTERVAPDLRVQLRLTWLGGMTVLRKIESVGYDVFRAQAIPG